MTITDKPMVSDEELLMLLRETELTVSQIAARIGRTPSLVTIRVKQATGVTPLRYREQHGWANQTTPPRKVRLIADYYSDPLAAPRAGELAPWYPSIKGTAAFFRVCDSTVKAALDKAGVPIRYERPTTIDTHNIEEVCRRYLAGETCQQIADTYGVKEKTVRLALAKAGVPRRPRGSRGR